MELKSLSFVILYGLLPLETEKLFILKLSNLHLSFLLQHLQFLHLFPLLIILLLRQPALSINRLVLNEGNHHLPIPLTIDPFLLVDLPQELASL